MSVPEVKMNEAVLESFVKTHSYVTDAEIDDLVRRGEVRSQADVSFCWKLEDVLDAPELYDANPVLRDVCVMYANMGGIATRQFVRQCYQNQSSTGTQ